MTKRIFLIAFAITLFLNNAVAQETNATIDATIITNGPLKGLKKAGPGDIDPGTPMMINPATTPMYKENFELIPEMDIMRIMMSGDYMPEPYIDSTKTIKALVLRKATEEEKEQRKKMMQGNGQDPNQMKSDLQGKEALSFSVTDINGNQFTLEQLKGKVVVVNFWFVECKPCVMEMPELNKLVDKYKDQDVVFLAFGTNDKAKIETFLKTTEFKYNLIPNSKDIAALYKVKGFPTHIVIDKNSIISFVTTGYGPTTVEDINKKIESLMK